MSHVDSLGSTSSSGSSGPSCVPRPSALSPRSGLPVVGGLAEDGEHVPAGALRIPEGERALSPSLRSLSDRELLSRVKDLVSRERAVTLEILVHMIEVERRRLHLGLGYASMFDYCTRHLGYSSSAASRRIQSARCVRDYPDVYRLLEKNEVNLVTISLAASILTEANAKDVIGKIRGKSQREVEAIVATYRPPVSMRDRAKPVCVAVPAPDALRLNSTKDEHTPTAGSEKRPNTAASGSAAGPPRAGSMMQGLPQASTQPTADRPIAPASTVLEEKFLVQFLASKAFMKKLDRARALLSNRNGKLSYEFVLEAALDEFLKDHDPEERKKRREERREKADAGKKPEDRGAKKTPGSRDQREEEQSRRIRAAERDAVFARDNGRCTYVGSNGKRCETTHHLQIDHVIPRASGGTNTLGNLRLLCERHNKHEAERTLGAGAIGRFRRRE